MAYYTERHTMREPVKKTYDISVDVYTLIFQCCEKYYNNLAWKYPDQCPDGYGCCGLYDYFFNRCLSLIALAVEYLQ